MVTYFLFLGQMEVKTILNVSFQTLKISSKVLLKSKEFEWRASLGSMVIQNPDRDDKNFPELLFPQDQLKKVLF